MQLNSHPTKQDLISDIGFLTSASLADYSLPDRVRSINHWYHQAAVIMQAASTTWKWDDANNTTLPIGRDDLVSGQADYTLDDAMVEIERVEALDSNGNAYKLNPIDKSSITVAMTEYQSDPGTPMYYDKEGSSLFLYPAPNFNMTDGLIVYFVRHANVFETTDTDKEPGFAEAFHRYLSYGASLDYCEVFKSDRVPALVKKITDMEKRMKSFYGRREKDVRRIMRAAPPKAI